MTEGELGFEVDFGHGALEGRQVEERIVAEAASAARGLEDESIDGAFGRLDDFTVECGDQDAAITGGALVGRDFGEALEQDDVVPDVGVVVGIGRVDETGVGCIASGTDAGSAIEGVDFEAGVVGEDELAGGETRVIDGFDSGVGEEGVAVFFGGWDVVGSGQRVNKDGVGVGGGAEVAELALTGCGCEKTESHEESVTVVGACGLCRNGN